MNALAPPTTRRQLLRGGIAATVLASAMAAPQLAGAAMPAPSDSDLVAAALGIEQLVVIAYRQALVSGALDTGAAHLMRRLLSHELVHAQTLRRELRRLGGTIPMPPASLAAAQADLARQQVTVSLLHLPDRHACLRLLIDVETVAEAAYYTGISGLRDPALVRTFIAAMGCEAQHWAVLSALQHGGDVDQAVPYAFVRGSAGI